MCSNENELYKISSFREYCEKKNLNMKFFTYCTDYIFINSKSSTAPKSALPIILNIFFEN